MTDVGQSRRSDAGGHGSAPRILDACIAAVVSLLCILILVPVDGTLPGINVDLSWPYTLAYAAARRIPFGRDMIFTFGPMSSIYTRFFLPDQRLAVFIPKATLVLAFSLGAVAISRRSLRWMALLLPVLIANLFLVDSFFLAAPWIIVPLAAAPRSDQRWRVVGLVALAAVTGPLVLVKGTLAIPVCASIAAAAVLVARRSWLQASSLPCAAAASVAVAWLATGQRFLDLPYYFKRQAYVAEGYTDAMSWFGDPREIWIYLAGAALLVATSLVPRRASRATLPGSMPALVGAAILFVAFKAGFVRHDLHANIAGGTLALLGFLLFLHRGGAAATVGLVVSLGAWSLIGADYWAVDPASNWGRFADAVEREAHALRVAVGDPDAFRRNFEIGKAKVAAVAALPPTDGTVDLYPDDQELLLAADRDYYPRPVMQSYSAYTPELAFLNAEHLEGPHAPRTAFFDISPIDAHYPTMEDGPSWPALLGQYRFRTYAGTYAVLDREPGASPGAIDPPFTTGTPRFGDEVTVPAGGPFIWVRMQFHPTPLGRLASAVFKRPVIHLDVTTADGQTRTFRLVAGMASAGFLLSPTVNSAHDFVALRSTATDALADQRVTAIRLWQDGASRLWGDRFDVAFSALRVPPDPAVDDNVLGRLASGPTADALPTSGECVIDAVGQASPGAEPIAVAASTVTVSGWGFTSPGAAGRVGGDLRIALTDGDGVTRYAGAERSPRPDVDANFHLPTPTRAGFTAQVNLGDIAGLAKVQVVQDGPSGPAACGAPVAIHRSGVQ